MTYGYLYNLNLCCCALFVVDVKILSKVLFLRIHPIVNRVVGSDQTRSVKGRVMSDNLSLVRDFYLCSQERNRPLCILGLDLEKVFDSVSHHYLKVVLKRLNFGRVFRRWVNVLHTGCNSVIRVNGRSTDPVDIQ